jgi:hypothetical protein
LRRNAQNALYLGLSAAFIYLRKRSIKLWIAKKILYHQSESGLKAGFFFGSYQE